MSMCAKRVSGIGCRVWIGNGSDSIPYSRYPIPSLPALYFTPRIAYGGGLWQPFVADIKSFNWGCCWADKQDVPAVFLGTRSG